MKKTKFAAILSLGMVPALFWSSESSAIPSWARKYNVSCYMCHSGFPQRNAVGEAFQANGFRFAGATEEALTKQKNIKIGNDEWKKSPNAPFTGSFPQFDPLSMTLGGNLINYTAPQTNRTTGASTGKVFNWTAPNTVSMFYGGSLGDNITFFGQIGGIGAASTAVSSNAKVVLMLSPGFNFSMGTNFSASGWNGSGAGGVVNVSNLLPAPNNYAELQFTRGETAGYSIVGGASVGAPPLTATAANEINDMVYLRAKAKLLGAGMLSGANGTLGNSYNGLDNQVTVGLGLSSAKKNIFTGNYVGETFIWGGDVQGVYNNALVGLAASRDQDLNLTNVRGDAGYFIYPWLFAKISYNNIAAHTTANALSGLNFRQPTITPSVVAWVAPNVSVTATYTTYTKGWKESAAVGTTLANNLSNQNTFRLAFSAGF